MTECQDYLKLCNSSDSVTLINMLCTSSLQLAKEHKLLLQLSGAKDLWSKIQHCLLTGEPSLRKRATFLTNLLISHDEALRDKMLDIVLVLETLEETQGHIIRPVLNKIYSIHENCVRGAVELSWLHVIFERFLSQESKMISRWGLQLFLDLPVSTFSSAQGVSIVADVLRNHLPKTYMFYRPSFLDPGSTPPVANQLISFFREFFALSHSYHCEVLFSAILDLLSSTKVGFIPLTMISLVMKDQNLGFPLRFEHISTLCTVFSSVLATKPEGVRQYVKTCLLTMVAKNLDQNDDEERLNLFMPLLDQCNDIQLTNFDACSNQDLFKISPITLRIELQKLSSAPFRTRRISMLLSLPINCTAENCSIVIEPLRTCATNVYLPLEVVVGHAGVLQECSQLQVPEDMKEEIIENLKVVLGRIAEKPNCDRRYLETISGLLFKIGAASGKNFSFCCHPVRPSSEPIVLLQLAALVKEAVVAEVDEDAMKWVSPYLTSKDLALLESAWIIAERSNTNKTSGEYLERAPEAMDRVRDVYVLGALFRIVAGSDPGDVESLESCLRCMWTVLQDAVNTARYWPFMGSFCGLLAGAVQSSTCYEVTSRWIERLLEIANTKDTVYCILTDSLSNGNVIPEEYLALFAKMTLFGGVRSREKKNREDLEDFLQLESRNRVCASRIGMIASINRTLGVHPEYGPSLLQHYLDHFFSFERAALMNSIPNRMRIRIWQSLLCFLPSLLKTMDSGEVFDKVMECFDRDSQPSVRCLIECGVAVILDREPSLLHRLYDTLGEFNSSHSNAYITAVHSIVMHFMYTLHLRGELVSGQLEQALELVIIWTSANNHNIRTFAGSTVLRLAELFELRQWEIPTQFSAQVKFLSASSDYQKIHTKLTKFNKYFSEFNSHHHLTVFNIFAGLPALFGVMEDERMRDEECGIISGKFYDLPYPIDGDRLSPAPTNQNQESDYLICWDDLLRDGAASESLQKKITPWRLMASSLELPCERSSHGELVVFASFIDKPTNLGGLSRTAEIFGVRRLIVHSLEVLQNKEFRSLSLTSEKWLEVAEVSRDLASVTAYLRHAKEEQGYTVVGVEQATNSVPLQEYRFPVRSILVLGREKDGVPAPVLDLLDVCLEIPQTGVIRSLNVHVTGSIAVWEYTRQHLPTSTNGA